MCRPACSANQSKGSTVAVTIDEAKAREHREKMASQTWYDVDSALSGFLDQIFGREDENAEGSAGMTLVVQGTIISGTVVSGAKYQESLAATVETASPELAEQLRMRAKIRQELQPEVDALNEGLMALRQFVNFGTANVISGDNWTELKDLRVSLKDVSAWSIGSLNKA